MARQRDRRGAGVLDEGDDDRPRVDADARVAVLTGRSNIDLRA